MLEVISKNVTNSEGKYVLTVNAKDVPIGAGYADYNGEAVIPILQVGQFGVIRLVQPVDGPTYVQVNKLTDTEDLPDPTRSKIISVFPTYNYADKQSDWHQRPITFLQKEQDVWFGSDASVEMHWTLPRYYEGWAPKSIHHWVPTGYADHAVFRVEVGAIWSDNNYVQANIAAGDNGFCSREVKGWSDTREKYCIDSGLVVPLLDNYVWCSGYNAKINLLLAGYRLKDI